MNELLYKRSISIMAHPPLKNKRKVKQKKYLQVWQVYWEVKLNSLSIIGRCHEDCSLRLRRSPPDHQLSKPFYHLIICSKTLGFISQFSSKMCFPFVVDRDNICSWSNIKWLDMKEVWCVLRRWMAELRLSWTAPPAWDNMMT